MNNIRMALAVLGVLFTFVGVGEAFNAKGADHPAEHRLWCGTLLISGAILLSATVIAWAISDAGQNSKKNAGN